MKLLRGFRMRAINSENVKHYLGYAVGEIILIVFSILLAMQISDWSEERNSQKKLQEYYIRLLANIRSNTVDYDLLIRINQARLDSIPVFLTLLYQEKSLAQVKQVVKMRIFIPRNSTSTKTTYEDLKSTGNFNLIQEIRIKGQLENYYKYLETTQETLDHLNARLGETPSLVVLREQLINYFEPVYAKGQHAIDWQWLNTPREVRFKAVEAQI